ncbi:MAG: hypothetical protein ACK56W_02310 [Pirellula sp.]|jgi:hypothetical protein|nr:hypothetical protein [Pirellula sp.]
MNCTGTRQIRIRTVGFLLLGACVATAPGCTICCQPYLDDYVAFGSSTPRVDMKHGRVGSPFSDPNLIGEVVHESAFARDGAISDPNAVLYYESEVPAEINSELSLDPSR